MFVLTALPAFGTRAPLTPVVHVQPDGSKVTIVVHGDESFSYRTTTDGYIVALGSDGYWYYADYGSGSLKLSTKRVSSTSQGISKTIPSSIYSYMSGPSRRMPERTADLNLLTRSQFRMKTLVIPVQFSDEFFTTASIRNRLYNLFNQLNYSEDGATGSVKDYFRDNLGALCDLSFDVCEPVTLPGTLRSYGANTENGSDSGIKKMVQQACNLADEAGVDFSQYDSDGDGVVDNVFIIYAGRNEAETDIDYLIWPQSWNISDLQQYHDGKKISNFSCYSEYAGTGDTFAGIGSICHEYCHYLGLKDMYDLNEDVEGRSDGLFGTLSIMDRGNYNNQGRTPPYLTVFEREMLGAVDMVTIEQECAISLLPVHSESHCYRFRCSYSDESFMLEFRDGTKWDRYVGATGLVIYHVDKTLNYAGSMTARLRWESNAVNCCRAHECVKPVSNDGTAFAENIADIFFPGQNNVTVIHSDMTFPLVGWNGTGVGFGMRNIRRESGRMMMDVVEDRSWNLPVVTAYSFETEQRSAHLSWEATRDLGGEWHLSWGSVSSVEPTEVVTHSLEYTFDNLAPGTDYYCMIRYEYSGVSSKTYTLYFKTMSMLSQYPVIADMRNDFRVGDSVRLHLLNLVQEVFRIKWYVNGVLNESQNLTFTQDGTYQLRVEIVYTDGSTEVLNKRIKVYGE